MGFDKNQKLEYELPSTITKMLLNILFTKLAFEGDKRYVLQRDITLLN